jgi:peptide/nickel transport system permease protein
MRRFLRHRMAMVSLAVLVLVFLLAFVVAYVWPHSYIYETNDYTAYNTGPSSTYPFGTDNRGHDYFALVMRGTQRSLEIAFFVAFFSTLVGTVYGAIAGYYRGWVDALMMRGVDVLLTIPLLAIAILLDGKVGAGASGWLGISILLAALSWPAISRVVRSQVLSLREKEFVEAARALGATDRRIIFRHILPNAAGTLTVIATLMVAAAILIESALSFLGFGVQSPDTSLGLLINQHQDALASGTGWLFWFPGLFIIVIALSINFIGDGLRDAFDPKQTRVRA